MERFQMPMPFPTVNKTLRLSNYLISDIERKIFGTNCTVSAFINEAARVLVVNVEEHGLKIKIRPMSTVFTVNKTIRMPENLVKALKQIADENNCTFSAILVLAIHNALEDLAQQ